MGLDGLDGLVAHSGISICHDLNLFLLPLVVLPLLADDVALCSFVHQVDSGHGNRPGEQLLRLLVLLFGPVGGRQVRDLVVQVVGHQILVLHRCDQLLPVLVLADDVAELVLHPLLQLRAQLHLVRVVLGASQALVGRLRLLCSFFFFFLSFRLSEIFPTQRLSFSLPELAHVVGPGVHAEGVHLPPAHGVKVVLKPGNQVCRGRYFKRPVSKIDVEWSFCVFGVGCEVAHGLLFRQEQGLHAAKQRCHQVVRCSEHVIHVVWFNVGKPWVSEALAGAFVFH